MGQIQMNVTGTTVGTLTMAADVPTADSDRLVAHFGRQYGIAPVSQAAVAQILQTWFKATVNMALTQSAEGERQIAVNAAMEAANTATGIAVTFS